MPVPHGRLSKTGGTALHAPGFAMLCQYPFAKRPHTRGGRQVEAADMVSRGNQTHPPSTGDVGGTLDAQRLVLGAGSFERLDLNSDAFGAEGTRAIQDLATSFPALLFALTTGYATPERRRACLAAIVAGARLKTAAQTLGLPFWLRRLPAAALTGPLPELPDDREFALAVVPALPKSPDAMLPWLDFLSLADRLAGRDVCLWFLRNSRLAPPIAQA